MVTTAQLSCSEFVQVSVLSAQQLGSVGFKMKLH